MPDWHSPTTSFSLAHSLPAEDFAVAFSEESHLLFPCKAEMGEEGQAEVRILPVNHANTHA